MTIDHLYPPASRHAYAAASSEPPQCSFCRATDGRRLVRGSGAVGAFICCECVVLAGNLFEEDEMDKRAPVPRWTAGCWSMPDFDAFGNLLSPENYFNDVLQALGE